MNAHVFVPPTKTVVNAWGTLGNPGWNWKTMESYYAKTYSLEAPEPALQEHLGISWMNKNHAFPSGRIRTSYTGSLKDSIPRAWGDTFKALGYSMTTNPFAGGASGAFSCLASIDPVKKERSYAATAYYAPASDRQNLHVLTNCTVQKILIEVNGSDKYATGVQYLQDGKTVLAKARKEVILAAGALNSPKMLEQSGVGNATLLRAHGVDVLVDNPRVGENLQDHIVCSIGYEAADEVNTLDDLVRQDPKAVEAAMGEYLTSKTGPLTSVGVESYAYLPVMEYLTENGQTELNSLLDKYTPTENDLQNPATASYYNAVKSILKSKEESSGSYLTVATQSVLPTDPKHEDSPTGPVAGKFITLGTMLSHPLSRGSVHINSSNPGEAPVVQPRYLHHPLDMEVFARHMHYLETIAASKPFQSVLKENGRRRDPRSRLDSPEAAKDYIRSSAISMWHFVGTCSMMPKEKGGVVDEQLLVYGVSNLRVVDASVIPLIPRANIQSSVYAVAERAADLIKAKHGLVSE